MRETKVNGCTVAQYMYVISHLPENEIAKNTLSAESREILNKFILCTESHKKTNSDEWGSFNAILIMFQCLYRKANTDLIDWKKQDNSRDLQALFGLFREYEGELQDLKVKSNIFGSNADMFLFEETKREKHKNTHIFDIDNPDLGDEKDIEEIVKKKIELILEGCSKDSTIDTVIRRLKRYVREEKLAAFQKMARRGFDVDLSYVAEKHKGNLWNTCDTLYRNGARQIVFTGAPGTGKTYTAKEFAKSKVRQYLGDDTNLKVHIETVQFHSGYDYSDFVEGLRPVQTAENGEMTFVRLDGQFKAFCRKILDSKDHHAPYFFIIDEINRADLSRVFGELMFCLDESNRSEETRVQTQYSNLPTFYIDEASGIATKMTKEEDVYKEGFYIPENLCILATMNDIDRSVETFDFALRRRFKWIEAKANEEMENGLLGMLVGSGLSEDEIKELAENAKAMNEVIASKDSSGEKLRLTKDYHIGHAYFKKYKGKNLQDIWDTQIEQILREYCRGRSKTDDVNNFIKDCYDALFPKQKINSK